VEILGRVDRQVKLRGVRIELEEIEAVLRGHPDIGDCCIMLDAAPDTPQLVAYLVTKGAASIHSTSSLRHYLADRVPAVMIPSRFMHVTDIPRTDRGKADHAALKRRASQPLTLGQQFIAPRNDTEAALAGIWQQLLGVERVGVDDNFFDLGGHSLLATRLMSRILVTLEVELPLRLLFERPTIAGLAAEIGTRRTGVASIACVPVTHVELPLPEDVAALSEEEVESLLQSMLQPRTNE
jgi:acyl carrier protein